MILTKVRPSLYMPFWVCIWSCISAATAGVHNFTGLVLVRFFLGKSFPLLETEHDEVEWAVVTSQSIVVILSDCRESLDSSRCISRPSHEY